jgi:hypothetical protein
MVWWGRWIVEPLKGLVNKKKGWDGANGRRGPMNLKYEFTSEWIYTHTSLFLLFFHSMKEPSNLTILSQLWGCLKEREREREREMGSFLYPPTIVSKANEWINEWMNEYLVLWCIPSKRWWIPYISTKSWVVSPPRLGGFHWELLGIL